MSNNNNTSAAPEEEWICVDPDPDQLVPDIDFYGLPNFAALPSHPWLFTGPPASQPQAALTAAAHDPQRPLQPPLRNASSTSTLGQSQSGAPAPSVSPAQDANRCPHCDENFNSVKAFRRHKNEQHFLKKIWICPLCPLRAGLAREVNNTTTTTTTNNSNSSSSNSSGNSRRMLECSYCGQPSPSIAHHMDAHYGCISFFNSKAFKRGHDFKTHVRDAHPAATAAGLLPDQNWIVTDHSADVTRCCDRCGAILRGLSALERHKAACRTARDHAPGSAPPEGTRLTNAIRGLLAHEPRASAWSMFLSARGLPLNLAAMVVWRFDRETCALLWRLERFGDYNLVPRADEDALFLQLQQCAVFSRQV